MNVESGFLGNSGRKASKVGAESADFTGMQTLYVSSSGFFRILLAKHLGRKVVVKTLKEDCLGNPVAIAQLRKEFHVLFPISSPHVVQAFRLIDFQPGVPAIEMEWCDGQDVRQLMEDGLPPEAAVEIVRGVLAGLRDIHPAGIIHRDIKPENVVYDPFRRVVKIIDFGCAYLTGSLTLQGPNGTPGYTPEAKTVTGAQPEPKDDLFALGRMTEELAYALSPEAKSTPSTKNQLLRFSRQLLAGSFSKADQASDAFEQILQKKSFPRRSWLVALSIGAIAVLGGIGAFFHRQSLKDEEAPSLVSSTTDSLHLSTSSTASEDLSESSSLSSPSSSLPTGAPNPAATESATKPLPSDQPPPQAAPSSPAPEEAKNHATTKEGSAKEREYLNPYSAISTEDEAAYELAIYAGPLLSRAESPHASQQTKMDAFVVQFSDSIYKVHDMWHAYPRDIEETRMRKLASTLADKYAAEMERNFRSRFGSAGSQHHRRVMLEGRFYGTLLTFHKAYHPAKKP